MKAAQGANLQASFCASVIQPARWPLICELVAPKPQSYNPLVSIWLRLDARNVFLCLLCLYCNYGNLLYLLVCVVLVSVMYASFSSLLSIVCEMVQAQGNYRGLLLGTNTTELVCANPILFSSMCKATY